MARWHVATVAAVLVLAACASAQPFTLASGASVTTSVTTLPSSGTNVVVRFTAQEPMTDASEHANELLSQSQLSLQCPAWPSPSNKSTHTGAKSSSRHTSPQCLMSMSKEICQLLLYQVLASGWRCCMCTMHRRPSHYAAQTGGANAVFTLWYLEHWTNGAAAPCWGARHISYTFLRRVCRSLLTVALVCGVSQPILVMRLLAHFDCHCAGVMVWHPQTDHWRRHRAVRASARHHRGHPGAP